MSTWPLRAAMVPISRRVRAYFAPYDRENDVPAVFDPAENAGFVLDAPPAPWIDLGWIENFRRTSGTPTEAMVTGARGATTAQFRGAIEARVDCDFREWDKLQMALAGGSEHMNVLATVGNTAARASGGTPLGAVAVLPESTDGEIVVGVGAVDAFAVGDLVAVDVDFGQQAGYVGSGIAAAYVMDPRDVGHDPNYVRRVTFNVGRVAAKTATSLLLAQALPGGCPANGAGIQKVVAFLDREGGTYFQDWSALFIAEEEGGGRVCFYYPRLSPTAGKNGVGEREGASDIAKPLAALALHASFLALPSRDENDGQTVVCYRSYFPAALAAAF